MLKLGSLFSGIGGLDMGFERTGRFKTIWQSEIDPYASAVLQKHWPDVPNLGDITRINWGGSNVPTSSPAAFHAKTSAKRAKEKALKANALACGESSIDVLREPGQNGLSSKTCQGSLPSAWERSWRTCGARVTRRSGLFLLKQPRLARRTSVNASSSWPTPTTADAFTDKLKSTQQKEGSMHSLSQAQAVQMWPTPRANERSQRNSRDAGVALSRAVKFWPTPTVNDSKNDGAPSQFKRH